MLCKEDYINTLRRINILMEKEMKKVPYSDLSLALKEPIVKKEKKKIFKKYSDD